MTALSNLVNGIDGAAVDVLDRGLHYGDGLFETMAVREGHIPLWDRHMRRLAHGCARIGLRMPETALLAAEAQAVCTGVSRAVLKLIVTRGTGGRGPRPDPAAQPTRIFTLHPWPEHPPTNATEGIVARLCRTRLARNPLLAGLKHLNWLERVLARAEWDDAAIAEGILLDTGGRVIEGTVTNLFIVRDGQLVTPDLSECGVAGIMRGMILECVASLHSACEVRPVNLDELLSADEAFVCNSVAGIWPLRRLETREYRVGPVTHRLMQAVHDTVG